MTEQQNATYEEQVKADFKEFFQENYSERYAQAETEQERSELDNEAYQAALDSDNVTGNISGSYYMNAYKARKMVERNLAYIAQLLYCYEFTEQPIGYYIGNAAYEELDVIARFYTLEYLNDTGELI